MNETFEHIAEKHNLYRLLGLKKIYDLKLILAYCIRKMNKYNFSTYPTNTLLVLDDMAGHDLIKKVESPLAKIFTKCRHYHLTVILAAQTWRFINLNLKRLCSDLIIGAGYSEEDFKKMILQTPSSIDWRTLWVKYKLLSEHQKLVIHCITNSIEWIE